MVVSTTRQPPARPGTWPPPKRSFRMSSQPWTASRRCRTTTWPGPPGTRSLSRCTRGSSRTDARHRIDDLLEIVIAGGPPTARALHDDVIGYRNNHLAHVLSDLDQAGVLVEVQTRPGQVRRRHTAWVGSAFAVTGPAIGHFRDLADALRQVVVMKRDLALDRVRRENEDRPPQQLLALPPARAEGEPQMPVNAWRKERQTRAPRQPKRR